MEEPQSRAVLLRRLPLTLAATFTVVVAPLLALSLIRASGAIASAVPLVAAGAILSIAASTAGAAAWAAWSGSEDTLFADLMLWGWLRRWLLERRLDNAARLLGGAGGDASGGRPAALSSGRRVRLLKQLAATLELRHPGTRGHSRRVARHAAAIARRMGLPREEVARIRTAAAVHDIGKVGVPAAIIDKPGPLSEAELALIKGHAPAGARMVAGLGDRELARIVRHHHERIDGRGYPDDLTGEQIPLGARIVAVADTFDAITSTRPYRPARRHREALALLAAVAGTQLDPSAVRAFRGYYSGRRPVAFWALLLNGFRQLVASLAPELRLGGVVTAAALATAGAGGIAARPLHARRPPAALSLRAPPQVTRRLVSRFEPGPAAPQPRGTGAPHHPPSHSPSPSLAPARRVGPVVARGARTAPTVGAAGAGAQLGSTVSTPAVSLAAPGSTARQLAGSALPPSDAGRTGAAVLTPPGQVAKTDPVKAVAANAAPPKATPLASVPGSAARTGKSAAAAAGPPIGQSSVRR